MKNFQISCRGILVILILGISFGCVAKTRKVRESERAKPAKTATMEELIRLVNAQSEGIKSYQAKAQFELRSGSIASGELKDYHEITGFLLYRAPDHLRMIGQIPSFGLNALDMVSDGRQFRVAFAPYKKFVIGSAEDHPHSKKPLENLRPIHILETLIITPLVPPTPRHLLFREEASEGRNNYYVIYDVDLDAGVASLRRKLWIDRSNLRVARQQLYSDGGVLESDAHYGDYVPWGDVIYPKVIDFFRPPQDYGLKISFNDIKFNVPLEDSKFELAQPEGYELIEVGKNPAKP